MRSLSIKLNKSNHIFSEIDRLEGKGMTYPVHYSDGEDIQCEELITNAFDLAWELSCIRKEEHFTGRVRFLFH